jgi:hypothetical protein
MESGSHIGKIVLLVEHDQASAAVSSAQQT